MMDFFQRQNDLQTKSRMFFIVFFLVVGLAVLILYFITTPVMIFLGADWKGDPLTPETDFWAWCLRQLPSFIYGSPAELLSFQPIFIVCSFFATIILAVSIFEVRAIKENGIHFLAQAMGGKLIETPRNFQERQLVNVVEEMAVATNLPPPHLYIMEREQSINAVTAGLDHHDIFIAVTTGALTHLSRDELQGVVAHEFGHILNDDYRLNLIMAGWLGGLLFFYARGCDMFWQSIEIADPRIIALFGIPGVLLIIGGGFGRLMASVVQSAFSRQREFLADNEALRFTRNPGGLAGALKKIYAYPKHGTLKSGQALLMRSFFISTPTYFEGLLRTHPPLVERIRALEPDWDGELPKLNLAPPPPPAPKPGLTRLADKGLAATMGGQQLLVEAALGLTPGAGGILVLHLLALAGLSTKIPPASLKEAPPDSGADLPQELLRAAQDEPVALVAAIFIPGDPGLLPKVLKQIKPLIGQNLTDRVLSLKAMMGDKNRLALLQLARPSVANLGPEEREKLKQVVKYLVVVDGKFNLFEIAACQILEKTLNLLPAGSADELEVFGKCSQTLQQATVTVLSLLAQVSTDKADKAAKALASGQSHFNYWAPLPMIAGRDITSQSLLKALRILGKAPQNVKKIMVRAALTTALYDPDITAAKFEILTALAEALDMPAP